MRAAAWTPLRRALDKWRKDTPITGRHRKDVSSTHRPAYPFAVRAMTEKEWLGS